MVKYEIYQVKHGVDHEIFMRFAFMDYERTIRMHGEDSVKKENYDLVYELESANELSLDDLFYIFNANRPEDFRGRSLSVSDVVKTTDGYFFCDSFGWVKLDWED